MNSLTALMLAFLLVSLLSCGENKPKDQEETQDPDTMAVLEGQIDHNGISISYNDCGTGDTTLLFVHGWCIDQTYWSAQVEAFCPQYRVVTLDLPGFGKSGKNRDHWSVEAYGKDIQAIIGQLGLAHVILIGHSMGGDIILEAAHDNKAVIALIGVDNFKDVGEEYDEETEAGITKFMEMLKQDFGGTASTYAKQVLFHPSSDTLAKNRVVHDFATSDPTAAIGSLEGLFEYGPREAERLSGISQPLYLINSDGTPTNKEGLKATGVSFEVIDISATGHYPMIEKPEKFNLLLKQVLHKIGTAQQ